MNNSSNSFGAGGAPPTPSPVGTEKIERTKKHLDEAEVAGFCKLINSWKELRDDPDINSVLPIPPESMRLFEVVADGILLCKIENIIEPDVVPRKRLNFQPRTAFHRVENHTLAIVAAKRLGCTVVNIGAEDLAGQKAHLVLGLVWQLVRKVVLKGVSGSRTDVSGGSGDDALQLQHSPEQKLIQWMNQHLAASGSKRTVTNFSEDLKDGEVYYTLVQSLSSEAFQRALAASGLPPNHPVAALQPQQRLNIALHTVDADGGCVFLTPKDILNGNDKLNLAFIANLYTQYNAESDQSRELSAEEEAKRRAEEEEKEALRLKNEELARQLRETEEKLREFNLNQQKLLEQERAIQEREIQREREMEEILRRQEEAQRLHEEQIRQEWMRQQEEMQRKEMELYRQRMEIEELERQRQEEEERRIRAMYGPNGVPPPVPSRAAKPEGYVPPLPARDPNARASIMTQAYGGMPPPGQPAYPNTHLVEGGYYDEKGFYHDNRGGFYDLTGQYHYYNQPPHYLPAPVPGRPTTVNVYNNKKYQLKRGFFEKTGVGIDNFMKKL